MNHFLKRLKQVGSLDACKIECDKNSLCKAFSFFPQRTSKNCYMKGKLGKRKYHPSDEFLFAEKNSYDGKRRPVLSTPTPKTPTVKPSVTVTQSPSKPCCEGDFLNSHFHSDLSPNRYR